MSDEPALAALAALAELGGAGAVLDGSRIEKEEAVVPACPNGHKSRCAAPQCAHRKSSGRNVSNIHVS